MKNHRQLLEQIMTTSTELLYEIDNSDDRNDKRSVVESMIREHIDSDLIFNYLLNVEDWIRCAKREDRPVTKKSLPQSIRTRVFERDDYRCQNCKTRVSLTIDHIKPQKLNGSDDIGNLRTLCKKCNCSKKDKPLI